MSSFELKNIRRTMFVVKDGKLYLSHPNNNISHKDWFINEKWMECDDKSFIEKYPRGYIDSEGVYIYQGYKAYTPQISRKLLEKIITELHLKMKLDRKLHVFLGTTDYPKNEEGKKPPQNDLGSILNIFKKSES